MLVINCLGRYHCLMQLDFMWIGRYAGVIAEGSRSGKNYMNEIAASKRPEPDKKFHTGEVVTISTGHLFHDVFAAFLAPMLPLIIGKLGISVSMAGFLDVTRKLPSLANPFVGMLADRLSLRLFVIMAPAITAIAMCLLGLAPTYGILLLMLFVSGVSSTLFHVPAPVIIKKISADRIGTGMSLFMLGGELSRTLGPLVISGALALWGLEGTWRLMPVGIVASAVMFVKLRHLDIRPSAGKSGFRNIGITLKKMRFLLFCIGGYLLFSSSMKFALTLYLPTYLTSRGDSLWTASGYLALLQLAGALGSFLSGQLSDRIGRKRTLLIAGLLNPLLMMAYLKAPDPWAALILFLQGLVLFAPGPVLLALVQDGTTSHPAFINGVYMTISFLATSLMVLLTGFLMDRTTFELTYWISSFMALGALPFILMLPKVEKL